jgi:hypothetical protein
MIAEQIPIQYKTNKERGLPEDSWYALFFADGSWITEFDTNWSELSEIRVVGYFGRKKQVMVCKYPVSKIIVHHGDLMVEVEVKKEQELYQEMRSQVTFYPNGAKDENIAGRSVGLIMANEVIEERFLNGRQEEILGMRV